MLVKSNIVHCVKWLFVPSEQHFVLCCVNMWLHQTLYHTTNAPVVRVCSSLYMSAFIYSEMHTRTAGQNILP